MCQERGRKEEVNKFTVTAQAWPEGEMSVTAMQGEDLALRQGVSCVYIRGNEEEKALGEPTGGTQAYPPYPSVEQKRTRTTQSVLHIFFLEQINTCTCF